MQPTPAPSSPPTLDPEEPQQQPSYPAPPQNFGSAPFGVLVSLFDKLQNERKPERRRKFLDAWFNHWRNEKGYDLYPVLRLILPQKDRERSIYGLKEKNLAKIYIKLIPLGTKDPDAIRLLNWKKPSEKEKSSGDFPVVLHEVVSKRSSVIEGTLTIDALNDILDELAKNMGKQEIQLKILQRVYNRTTPEEQRWIVRVILKDMVISVKETTVFSVFHPDAQDLYNTCSDLKKVCWELWDPSRRLNDKDKEIQLFLPFAPMLCKRPTHKIEDTVKEMQGKKFIIEEKLDGERMQIHKRGGEYFYCSRKGKDYTYLYGKHVGTGSLTPFIDSAFDDRVDEIILDGEMLVWDPATGRNLPFGTLKTAALDKSKKEHNPRPCFKVFDLLRLNGNPLLHKSTKFRKRNMRSCLKEIQGRIEFAVEWEGKTAADVRQRMEEVMELRGEGLVIKHPESEYVLNGRNKDWIKVKPEYMDNMGETVDVLVVGGNYGSGKRSGGVSTLICAVMDDRVSVDEDEDNEPKYSSFVRIGSGLSFADYVWIREKPWKEWDKKSPPDFFQTSKRSNEDKGDVYLNPEDSFIIKVKAAEIVVSGKDQYHMGYTMRFPRALSIRDDLSLADCLTASAVLETVRTERKRKMENDTDVTKKKRKSTAKKAEILPEYKGPKLKNVKVKSNLFGGLRFMVASDPKSRTGEQDRKELMMLIHTHGGKCVQIAKNPESLFVIYGGTMTPYDLQLLINKADYDIVKPQWIHDSIMRGDLAPLRKSYFFHATAARKESEDYDLPEEPVLDEVMTDGTQVKDEYESDANDFEEPKEEDEEEPEDIAMADWFKIPKDDAREGTPVQVAEEPDTETENDSDNQDVQEEAIEDLDPDDWFKVKPSSSQTLQTQESNKATEGEESSTYEKPDSEPELDVRMGETDDAMEYDTNLIFTHLCFYLDTPKNARKNGMVAKSKHEAAIEKSFAETEKLINENGGKVVELLEPKLTHIVIEKRDDSRRVDLMKRTSKPKRRHLVVSDFIQVCLDEGTLLDEEEFAP